MAFSAAVPVYLHEIETELKFFYIITSNIQFNYIIPWSLLANSVKIRDVNRFIFMTVYF